MTRWRTCDVCGGLGFLIKEDGRKQKCPKCEGRQWIAVHGGKEIEEFLEPCPYCGGPSRIVGEEFVCVKCKARF